MTLPQIYDLFDYWQTFPPEHEVLAMLASAYTDWEPRTTQPKSEAERHAEHMASLERRWQSGAMSPKHIVDAMGGNSGLRVIGGTDLPGIGPFPGLRS